MKISDIKKSLDNMVSVKIILGKDCVESIEAISKALDMKPSQLVTCYAYAIKDIYDTQGIDGILSAIKR